MARAARQSILGAPSGRLLLVSDLLKTCMNKRVSTLAKAGSCWLLEQEKREAFVNTNWIRFDWKWLVFGTSD